jgi:hypothetical protein
MQHGIMQDKSDTVDGRSGSYRKKKQLLAIVQSPRILWQEEAAALGEKCHSNRCGLATPVQMIIRKIL